MSVTTHDRLLSSNIRAIQLGSDEAEGNRRGQGWLIVLGTSALLWTGIIVAVVGIAGLGV
ncbi:MAG: hypothetical protein ACOH10_08860 [Rhodoglobus sp.]|uniref:hypothetical protein n=1 Tax=Salinibacterium sp. G-O1 TaxID=3046208 RepID=UPI0024B9D735|nr:hypothetical protein [Salinibacterium sp. G-O1]MDJ0335937.1 hypothetical protein [Salinibacterium sp. G-O1]